MPGSGALTGGKGIGVPPPGGMVKPPPKPVPVPVPPVPVLALNRLLEVKGTNAATMGKPPVHAATYFRGWLRVNVDSPVTASPGETARSPVSVGAPVFVTVEA